MRGRKITDEQSPEPPVSTPRVVIVVARDRPDLQTCFEEAFAGMPEVKVIRDRRIGDSDPTHWPDGAEPRERRDRYTELQERGFIIIRVGEVRLPG